MTTPLMLAEEYGLPVFPCGSNKQPLTPHGFKDATTKASQAKVESALVERK